MALPLKPLFRKERKTMRANTNKLNFYVSDVVRKKLEKLSKDSGLTMTAVITRLISKREIHPLKTDELLKIYNELNHIGNNNYNKQRFRFCGKTEVLLKTKDSGEHFYMPFTVCMKEPHNRELFSAVWFFIIFPVHTVPQN